MNRILPSSNRVGDQELTSSSPRFSSNTIPSPKLELSSSISSSYLGLEDTIPGLDMNRRLPSSNRVGDQQPKLTNSSPKFSSNPNQSPKMKKTMPSSNPSLDGENSSIPSSSSSSSPTLENKIPSQIEDKELPVSNPASSLKNLNCTIETIN